MNACIPYFKWSSTMYAKGSKKNYNGLFVIRWSVCTTYSGSLIADHKWCGTAKMQPICTIVFISLAKNFVLWLFKIILLLFTVFLNLGAVSEFKRKYENPILKGRDSEATEEQKKKGEEKLSEVSLNIPSYDADCWQYNSWYFHPLGQRSRAYESRARCVSFQDCIWLPDSQTNLSRLSSKYCKTANTSIKAFQGYYWCCIQLSNCSIGQVSDELEHFVVSCDTSAQLYGSRGTQFLNIRLSRLSLPNRFPIF